MTINVIVVDDSAFMRRVISDILNKDPEINVVATARNGRDAIEKIEKLRPDVVTLDVEMPVLNGLDALGYIMSECPTPVVMLSSVDERAAEITLTAFEYGAIDFIQKPSGRINPDISAVGDEICSKVKTAAYVDVNKLDFMEEHVRNNFRKQKSEGTQRDQKSENLSFSLQKPHINKKILAIGSSTGGPRALEQIIPRLPADFPAAVLVVQHMPAGFTASFSKRLDLHSMLSVREAKNGDIVKEGEVLVAPGDFHMEITEQKINGAIQGIVRLNKNPREKGVRPAVNYLFRSIAPIYGSNIVTLILTGMGSDGLEGVEAIKKMGGRSVVEDELTCVVYGMPKAIADRGLADNIIPLDNIADEIVQMFNKELRGSRN
ncbi:response regulator receiver modulated CheB methylesterase [Methanosalsum zhilinae DSM 4017]|uniref:Protein-glutamate methylesterase/protein-glutamine glutaminase n=1 Tax=Methanosalsum zhilinae (strain DSM 4017 / NBRC 107636 / OCM 62 / WeN5) TaxID=679901 RepID=F7XQE2_METZD|nr:chemotaxis response regulator protein-glutamate methylesterase [Methanosalsum zhilinae]AEH60443.1 response regulator receiver modulated CheB methylesterase [Methanosalsum zhilinae DSM 4017]